LPASIEKPPPPKATIWDSRSSMSWSVGATRRPAFRPVV
jgi:hypothetical protein